MDSVALPCERLSSGLQYLFKFYRYNKCYRTSAEDLHGQRLCIKYVYGQVHGTAARQICNDGILRKEIDTESTVCTQVLNVV